MRASIRDSRNVVLATRDDMTPREALMSWATGMGIPEENVHETQVYEPGEGLVVGAHIGSGTTFIRVHVTTEENVEQHREPYSPVWLTQRGRPR